MPAGRSAAGPSCAAKRRVYGPTLQVAKDTVTLAPGAFTRSAYPLAGVSHVETSSCEGPQLDHSSSSIGTETTAPVELHMKTPAPLLFVDVVAPAKMFLPGSCSAPMSSEAPAENPK
jgi:hypothetical protein